MRMLSTSEDYLNLRYRPCLCDQNHFRDMLGNKAVDHLVLVSQKKGKKRKTKPKANQPLRSLVECMFERRRRCWQRSRSMQRLAAICSTTICERRRRIASC